jgi:PAS domain S-box-containing protein
MKAEQTAAPTALRCRAEARLRKQQKRPKPVVGGSKRTADSQRLRHELEVHQVELEMQNAELHEARDRTEVLLDKYTSLYDYAPVGYFSLDEQGRILEVNLTGAAMLGLERSCLINCRLPQFVAPTSRPAFRSFLERLFTGPGGRASEAILLKAGGAAFWANFHAAFVSSISGRQRSCRVAVSDITALKRAEETQRQVETLTVASRELAAEITRRQAVEASLKLSLQEQVQSLALSRQMQEQLRRLSRQVLQTQEEERKRISRELHDVIAQALTGISIHLAKLTMRTTVNTKDLMRAISRTQRLVQKSVDIVHQFARELRPAALDHLGLVPALLSHLKQFTKETGLLVGLTSFTTGQIKGLDHAQLTVLYRVAQEALTNVARHAHACRVEVSLQKLPKSIQLQIQDDGKSFDVERVLFDKRKPRLGLLGMKERVEMVGGKFTVESVPGRGTTIQAQIPLGHGKARGGGAPLKPLRNPPIN